MADTYPKKKLLYIILTPDLKYIIYRRGDIFYIKKNLRSVYYTSQKVIYIFLKISLDKWKICAIINIGITIFIAYHKVTKKK